MTKKNKILKQKNIESEDVVQIRTLIILLIIVVLMVVGIYFLTDKMIEKEMNNSLVDTEAKIDHDIASIGTMFNRIENEYYVVLYSKRDDGSIIDKVLDSYRSSDDYVKTYYVDLDKKINSSVLGDNFVSSPKNSNEVKVKEATLYLIKNGKVDKSLSGSERIVEFFQG